MPSSILCLHCNPSKPCKCGLALFKSRPRAMSALRRTLDRMNPNRRRRNRNFSSVRAVFWPLMSMRSDERTDGPPSSTDSGMCAPSPSLDTPASRTAARVLALQAQLGEQQATTATTRKTSGGEGYEVEEACRSFENYLMEMLVEERKVRDLMDVEELLSCWEKLKIPVFVELVGRFYGELCMDLFSGRETEGSDGN